MKKYSVLLLSMLFALNLQADTVYEDAEDNTTNGWTVYDEVVGNAIDDNGTATDGLITNVYDAERGSRVISFNGTGLNNGYMLGFPGGWGNPNAWNNTTEKTLTWSMKYNQTDNDVENANNTYNEDYIIYVSVQTPKGHRLLAYTNSDENNGISFGTIHHGLGSGSSNGTWQTFTRDLEADLKDFDPDNNITSVDAFKIRGSGRIDDIKLLAD